MKHYYLKTIKAFALGFVTLSSVHVAAQDPFVLQLLHYADVDGNETSALESVDEFSALVNHFQNEAAYTNNTLTVTSGDIIIPGPRFYAAENSAVRSLTGSDEPGHIDIAFANAFGVDAAGFGNHELDQGPAELFDAAFSSESYNSVDFPGSTFPWLSANIDFSVDYDFSTAMGNNGDDISTLHSQVANYAVVTVNGETIGLVGAVAPSFPNITSVGDLVVSPLPDGTIAELAAEIQPSIDALLNSGVNKIILLAHMQSISIEKQLAEVLDGVDIIVAGGSNTRMGDDNDVLFSSSLVSDPAFDETYPFQTNGASGDPVLVVNVDGDYKYLGRLVVEFDAEGIIDLSQLDTDLNGSYASNESLIESLGATPIASVVEIRDAVQGVIDEQFNNVIGYSSVYLDGRRSQVRTQETNLGDLTADANLWYANLLNPDADAAVDISLKNGGGLRTEIGSAIIPSGSNDPDDIIYSAPAENKVSEGHLRATLRFDNGLVRLTLNAEELIMLLEHSLNGVAPGATPGAFPQVAGMNFTYDPNLDAGSRLVDLIIHQGDEDSSNDITVLDNGTNVAPDGITFNMVTLNFLATGGDGYPFDQLSAPSRMNYYEGLGFGETEDFPDATLANDPENNTSFSYTGGEQDALAEYMLNFYPDNDTAYDMAETDGDSDTRIVITDFTSSITDANASGIDVKLFPNPVSSYSTFTVTSSTQIAEVHVYGIDGKMIVNETVNATHIELTTENMPSGLFLVKVISTTGDTTVLKAVIE